MTAMTMNAMASGTSSDTVSAGGCPVDEHADELWVCELEGNRAKERGRENPEPSAGRGGGTSQRV